MSDTFLSRWSRRKQAATRPDAEPETPPAPTPAAEGAGDGSDPAGDDALTAEEIAALPPLDSLTADTDITAFLRKGVPHVLRNAALRRAWALDPVVRDFVCEAREYAYDWNVPGGVPGCGPLLPTDDPQAIIEQMFSKARPVEESDESPEIATEPAAGEATPGGEHPTPAATAAPDALAQADETPQPTRLSEPPSRSADDRAAAASLVEKAVFRPERPEMVRVRRQGSAVPD